MSIFTCSCGKRFADRDLLQRHLTGYKIAKQSVRHPTSENHAQPRFHAPTIGNGPQNLNTEKQGQYGIRSSVDAPAPGTTKTVNVNTDHLAGMHQCSQCSEKPYAFIQSLAFHLQTKHPEYLDGFIAAQGKSDTPTPIASSASRVPAPEPPQYQHAHHSKKGFESVKAQATHVEAGHYGNSTQRPALSLSTPVLSRPVQDYPCRQCNKKPFGSSGALQAHVRYVHGDQSAQPSLQTCNPIPMAAKVVKEARKEDFVCSRVAEWRTSVDQNTITCDECLQSRAFNSPEALAAHKKDKHPTKQYNLPDWAAHKCPLCDRIGFDSQEAFAVHVKARH